MGRQQLIDKAHDFLHKNNSQYRLFNSFTELEGMMSDFVEELIDELQQELLPDDVEIAIKAEKESIEYTSSESDGIRTGVEIGAKWMREKLHVLNKKK